MMKHFKYIALALSGLITFTGCGDFGDINVDPNNPSSADTRYLFAYACKKVPLFTMVGTYDPWNQLYPQYLAERKNIQYSGYAMTDFNTGSYYYETIRNLNDIISLNTDEATSGEPYVRQFGSVNNQIAVSRTLRAFIYMHLTDILGMIPYSEALKGEEGSFNPKYDTQEFIYQDLDRELTESYTQFDESSSLDNKYDILYNGNVTYWKKLNASVRMMMAIKLSDVDPASGKERFARAYADGGMTDNKELLEYKYLDEDANQNPLYANIALGRADFAPSKTILDQLLAYNDPRVEAYAEPNSKDEYAGVPFGITQTEMAAYKDCATFDPRYYKRNSPMVVISPSHILLIEAEAALRGWITADAETLYKAGIAASFEQYDLEDEVDAYLAQPAIVFTGSDQEKLEKIAMQRWLGNFMQDGVEAWSDWRRLNVPKLKPGSAASVTHIPYRRHYYPDDYTTNMVNHNAALAIQGADNFDTRVWWDVAPND